MTILRATILASSLLGCGIATADPVADFYKGKTITILVPIGPGGTYDLYARLGAEILQKHLPGKPQVITQLMTGGGGAGSTNYLANRSPQDGTSLISLHGSAPQNQVLGVTGVSYDLGKFLMVGQFSPLNSSLTVWRATAPATTIEEAKKKEVVLGSTGAGSYQYQLPVLLNALIGTKIKVVLGYRGSAEIALALQRGELDAMYVTDASAANYEKGQQARVIGIGARKRSALLPQVPTLYEALKLTPEQEWWLDFRTDLNQYGRVLLTMPGIPADRLAHLRAAIGKVLTDPAVIAEGAKTQRFIEYRDAATMQKLAQKLVGQLTPERKSQVREVVLKKFIN